MSKGNNRMNVDYVEHMSPQVIITDKKVGPKILVNPYYGCEHRCLFCPANDGFLNKKVFDDFREKGKLVVVDNIVDHIKNYVTGNENAKILHLSPVADPFQPIEKKLHMSEKIIEYANEANIPIAICTKGNIAEKLYPAIAQNPKSLVQISIITINEEKRSKLVRGGYGTVANLLNSIEDMTVYGIKVIARIDPIFPYITDDMGEFEQLVAELTKRNVNLVISSVADIVDSALDRERAYLESISVGLYRKYKELYVDSINGRLHAKFEYRDRLFRQMKQICENHQVYFGITWEPDQEGNSIGKNYSHIFPNEYSSIV